MAKASSPELHELAEAAGVQRQWRDVEGRDRLVGDDALRAILTAFGYPADNSRKIKASLSGLAERQHRPPPMLVTEVGQATSLHTTATSAELTGEDGVTRRIEIVDGCLAPLAEPGYFDLAVGGETRKLAVAPRHCPLPAGRGWGISIQIPALRGGTARAFGGFAELADAAQTLGQAGCAALAINPVHAMFPGFGEGFSPYSPSSRTFLNAAMGDPAVLVDAMNGTIFVAALWSNGARGCTRPRWCWAKYSLPPCRSWE